MLTMTYEPRGDRATMAELLSVAGSVAHLRQVAADVTQAKGRTPRISELVDEFLEIQREAVEEPEYEPY